jgi:GT2 family glycosyltransferase
MLERVAALDRVRVVRDTDGFNFSRLVNRGRREAGGEILLLLNDDVESRDRHWLAALADAACREGVGCVGALLLYADGRVQHAGMALGLGGGVVGHAYRFADPEREPRIADEREVSAVTGACLAVRASLFDAVGGFAEDLPVTLNDVDFCLKVRAAGLRNLYLPQACLVHREQATRGLDASPEKLARLAAETAVFTARWHAQLPDDPYVSPHIDQGHEDMRPLAI